MNVRALAGISAIAWMACGASAVAQGDTGRIAGRVLLFGDAPWPGAQVVATGPAARQSATTDRDGRFEMAGLAPGQYTLTAQIRKDGEEIERRVTVSPPRQVNVDFAFPFDPCLGDVDYVAEDPATLFRRSSAVVHVRILERTATIPRGGECGRPSYRYSAAVIRTLENPSFAGAFGRTIVISSEAVLENDAAYSLWLDAWSHAIELKVTRNANEEMLKRTQESRVDGVFEEINRAVELGAPLPDNDSLVRALQSQDYETKQAMVLRLANRRPGALDARTIDLLCRELERAAEVERRLSGSRAVQNGLDSASYEYSSVLSDVLTQQRDPRAIRALAPYIGSRAHRALIQFGSAAVPALAAGLSQRDVSAHGYFRAVTFQAFEQMLSEPTIAATLSPQDHVMIRAAASQWMLTPAAASDKADPHSGEIGRYILEAAARLAIRTGDPDLRRLASDLIDNDAAFDKRGIDVKWVPLISTHLRQALRE